MEGLAEAIGPVFGALIFFSVPLAVILTRHQQKMALILRGPDHHQPPELESQVQELTRQIRYQSAMIEDLRKTVEEVRRKDDIPLEMRLSDRS